MDEKVDRVIGFFLDDSNGTRGPIALVWWIGWVIQLLFLLPFVGAELARNLLRRFVGNSK